MMGILRRVPSFITRDVKLFLPTMTKWSPEIWGNVNNNNKHKTSASPFEKSFAEHFPFPFSLTQWKAVRTCWLVMRVPPQKHQGLPELIPSHIRTILRRRGFFREAFSPFFIFNKISSFAKKTWRYHLNLLCGKPMAKTVYLGVELVKNEIIVLSFIELLVLDPKQSINMKVDE